MAGRAAQSTLVTCMRLREGAVGRGEVTHRSIGAHPRQRGRCGDQSARRDRLPASDSHTPLPTLADERDDAARSALANKAVRARVPVDVSVAIPCVHRPRAGRRLLGPASMKSPPFPRGAPDARLSHRQQKTPSRSRERHNMTSANISGQACERGESAPSVSTDTTGDTGTPTAMPTASILAATPSWSSFSTARRRARSGAQPCTLDSPSHFGLRLIPAEPVLIVGVSRRC